MVEKEKKNEKRTTMKNPKIFGRTLKKDWKEKERGLKTGHRRRKSGITC